MITYLGALWEDTPQTVEGGYPEAAVGSGLNEGGTTSR